MGGRGNSLRALKPIRTSAHGYQNHRPLLRTLFLAVCVVRVISSINVAGLLLLRTIRRRREPETTRYRSTLNRVHSYRNEVLMLATCCFIEATTGPAIDG
jgi:hypothetical protein